MDSENHRIILGQTVEQLKNTQVIVDQIAKYTTETEKLIQMQKTLYVDPMNYLILEEAKEVIEESGREVKKIGKVSPEKLIDAETYRERIGFTGPEAQRRMWANLEQTDIGRAWSSIAPSLADKNIGFLALQSTNLGKNTGIIIDTNIGKGHDGEYKGCPVSRSFTISLQPKLNFPVSDVIEDALLNSEDRNRNIDSLKNLVHEAAHNNNSNHFNIVGTIPKEVSHTIQCLSESPWWEFTQEVLSNLASAEVGARVIPLTSYTWHTIQQSEKSDYIMAKTLKGEDAGALEARIVLLGALGIGSTEQSKILLEKLVAQQIKNKKFIQNELDFNWMSRFMDEILMDRMKVLGNECIQSFTDIPEDQRTTLPNIWSKRNKLLVQNAVLDGMITEYKMQDPVEGVVLIKRQLYENIEHEKQDKRNHVWHDRVGIPIAVNSLLAGPMCVFLELEWDADFENVIIRDYTYNTDREKDEQFIENRAEKINYVSKYVIDAMSASSRYPFLKGAKIIAKNGYAISAKIAEHFNLQQ